MSKNLSKSPLNKYLGYEIIYLKDQKELYKRSNMPCFPYSSMNDAVIATGCLTPERYATYRTILSLYISNPSLYKWHWYRREFMPEDYWNHIEDSIKYIPSKEIKLFKKECQRLINILDFNFKKKYNIN